jgi:NADPH-dependent 7-cyano-7-deazaguanine reductase QueF
MTSLEWYNNDQANIFNTIRGLVQPFYVVVEVVFTPARGSAIC